MGKETLISIERLDYLEEVEHKLCVLYAEGVEQWSGYVKALEKSREGQKLLMSRQRLVDDIDALGGDILPEKIMAVVVKHNVVFERLLPVPVYEKAVCSNCTHYGDEQCFCSGCIVGSEFNCSNFNRNVVSS